MKGRRIKGIAPLENFECEQHALHLGPNLRLRYIYDKEANSIRYCKMFSPITPAFHREVVPGLTYGLETSYRTETLLRPLGPPSLPDDLTITRIYRVVSALRLYKAGNLGCNIFLCLEKKPDSFLVLKLRPFIYYDPGLGNLSYHTSWTNKYVLNKAEVREFRRFWSKFEIMDKKNPGFLDEAIRRFNYTYERERLDDRLIDLIISFESLFLREGETQELAYRLSLRTAAMIAGESGERVDIFEDLKTAYNVRSKIVHGEDLVKIDRIINKRFASFDELSMKIQDYSRKSIRAFLQRVSKGRKKDKIIEDLDKGILLGNHRLEG